MKPADYEILWVLSLGGGLELTQGCIAPNTTYSKSHISNRCIHLHDEDILDRYERFYSLPQEVRLAFINRDVEKLNSFG